MEPELTGAESVAPELAKAESVEDAPPVTELDGTEPDKVALEEAVDAPVLAASLAVPVTVADVSSSDNVTPGLVNLVKVASTVRSKVAVLCASAMAARNEETITELNFIIFCCITCEVLSVINSRYKM